MQLSTKRFLLRDFVSSDGGALYTYQSDPRYGEFYAPEELSREKTAALLQLFMVWAEAEPRLNYQLAVVALDNPGELLGCAGLRAEGYAVGEAELGIELAPKVWGRYRYAIEIAEALLDFGFSELGLQTVIGISIDANSRVSKLAKHYGFELSPPKEEAAKAESEWLQSKGWKATYWRLSRERWAAQGK